MLLIHFANQRDNVESASAVSEDYKFENEISGGVELEESELTRPP